MYYWDTLSELQKQHLDYLLRGMALLQAAPAAAPTPAAPQHRVWKRTETAPACQHYFDANKTAILSGELKGPEIHRVLASEMGIPAGTVSSQLSAWRRRHGIVVRIDKKKIA